MTPLNIFRMKTIWVGVKSFRLNNGFVIVWPNIHRAVINNTINTPIKTSVLKVRKFNEPWVIAITKPKNNTMENTIWIFEIFSFNNKKPYNNPKKTEVFWVKDPLIAPANRYPTKNRSWLMLKIIPIKSNNQIFFFMLVKIELFDIKPGFPLSFLLFIRISKIMRGRNIIASTKHVIAANTWESIDLAEFAIIGWNPTRIVPIPPKIKPFFRLLLKISKKN